MCSPEYVNALRGAASAAAPNLAGAPTVANAAMLPYTTKLSPDEEKQFQAWAGANGVRDEPTYDMRGFWKAKQGGDPNATQADNGHFPDTYKKPNHPTFSDESQYSGKDSNVGGHWVQDADGNWVGYEASPTNLKYNSPEKMGAYFAEVEPETKLQILGGPLPIGDQSAVSQIFRRGVYR